MRSLGYGTALLAAAVAVSSWLAFDELWCVIVCAVVAILVAISLSHSWKRNLALFVLLSLLSIFLLLPAQCAVRDCGRQSPMWQ